MADLKGGKAQQYLRCCRCQYPVFNNGWNLVKDKKETEDFNNTIKQLDLTDIHRILHPTKAEYTFFSSALEHFSG